MPSCAPVGASSRKGCRRDTPTPSSAHICLLHVGWSVDEAPCLHGTLGAHVELPRLSQRHVCFPNFFLRRNRSEFWWRPDFGPAASVRNTSQPMRSSGACVALATEASMLRPHKTEIYNNSQYRNADIQTINDLLLSSLACVRAVHAPQSVCRLDCMFITAPSPNPGQVRKGSLPQLPERPRAAVNTSSNKEKLVYQKNRTQPVLSLTLRTAAMVVPCFGSDLRLLPPSPAFSFEACAHRQFVSRVCLPSSPSPSPTTGQIEEKDTNFQMNPAGAGGVVGRRARRSECFRLFSMK